MHLGQPQPGTDLGLGEISGRAADQLDGPPGGPDAGPGHAADAGPLPGFPRGPADRGTARPHPARGAAGRGGCAGPRWRPRLLRDGRRDPAVRRAAGGAAPVRAARDRGGRVVAGRRPRARVDRHHGDPNGDGFVEYRRATDRGLVNQGWKDSFDGINRGRRTLAAPPIALAEVQAYVYAAYTARVELADALRDQARARHWPKRAVALKAAFNERFGCRCGRPRGRPGRGGGPGRRRQLEHGPLSLCGNIGEARAPAVARHLLGPRLWTGFGVRTLADHMGAYNPVSYHNGSAQPHDSAIAAAGLARYGYRVEAQTVDRAAERGAARRRRSARLIRRDMSCARGSTCRRDVSASGRTDACSGIDTSRDDRVAGGRDQTTDSTERAGRAMC